MNKEEKQRWLKDGGEELRHTFEGIGPDSIVFDIGLYKGDWAREIARKYDSTIYGFEPLEEFYRDAVKALVNYPKIALFNCGLGRDTRQAVLYINNDASSLVEHSTGRSKVVKIRSIKAFMSEFEIDFVDLASINIEGAEYELLNYLIGAGLVPKFGQLLIQFHEVGEDHQSKRSTIRTALELTHEMVYVYDTVWELWKKRE